jgi:hypothetical protein
MTKSAFRAAVWIGAAALALGIGAASLTTDAAASPAFDAAKKCRKQLTVQGRNYYKKRVTHLLNCIDRLLKCEVLQEVDGGNQNACRSLANDLCNRRLRSAADSMISKAQGFFDTKVTASCLLQDISGMLSTGAGGLWFMNDGACNGSGDVPTLVECIREQEVEPLADAVVARTKPRAALLLANMGLGDEYPNIPLPGGAPVTVTLMGTAPSTNGNTLVDPGTINVAAGQVLKFVGDSSLICNPGGMNGKVTITIDGQVHQLKEPYDGSELALFGPYTTSGTRPYTIELKEGPCTDDATGDVSVP